MPPRTLITGDVGPGVSPDSTAGLNFGAAPNPTTVAQLPRLLPSQLAKIFQSLTSTQRTDLLRQLQGSPLLSSLKPVLASFVRNPTEGAFNNIGQVLSGLSLTDRQALRTSFFAIANGHLPPGVGPNRHDRVPEPEFLSPGDFVKRLVDHPEVLVPSIFLWPTIWETGGNVFLAIFKFAWNFFNPNDLW